MRYKNAVSLIGVAGKDAEIRTMQNGSKYATFSLCTSTGGYKKADGTDVPETKQWHRVVCWDRNADFAGQYVKKGMKVDIEGSIAYNEFTDQQGVKRTATDIVCRDIVLMSMPQGQQQAQAGAQQGYQPQQAYGGASQGAVAQGGYAAPAGGYQQPQQAQTTPSGGYAPQQGYAQPQQSPQQQAAPFPPTQPGDDMPF